MLIESNVFNGNKCISKHFRYVVEIGPIAVFDCGNRCDLIAVRIIQIGCAIALCKLCDVKPVRRIDIDLDNSVYQTGTGHADDQHRNDQQFQR